MSVLELEDIKAEYERCRIRYGAIQDVLARYCTKGIKLKGGWAEFNCLQKEKVMLAEYMMLLSSHAKIVSLTRNEVC